ncbi:hypothetical protein H2201_009389, partial [Coniosporium apollinis]
YQCGWVAPEDDAALAAMLRGATREQLAQRQAGVAEAAAAFNWEIEAANLVQRYRSLNLG